MIAQTLALALVLAAPGPRPAARPARAAPELQPDNAVRARRGLLPRKVARPRPASRVRRVVLVPPAPTWLGEPGEPIAAGPDPAPPEEVVTEIVLGADPVVAGAEVTPEPAVVAPEPVAAAGAEPPPAVAPGPDAASFAVALAGAEVGWLLVRRLEEPEATLQATISGAELEVVLVRLPGDLDP